jgi:hypothetical protein
MPYRLLYVCPASNGGLNILRTEDYPSRGTCTKAMPKDCVIVRNRETRTYMAYVKSGKK